MKKVLLLLLSCVTISSVEAQTTYSRKVVMEEGTGTWCGWCVRGIEAIKRMAEIAPDNFIAIGLHSGDEMQDPENYSPITDYYAFYPGCFINRRNLETEDVGLYEAYIAVKELKDNAIAKIEGTAQFEDEAKSSVLVKTTTTFGFDSSSADYKIAYVVTEDHVGPYYQRNFYSGMGLGEDDYMYSWGVMDAVVSVEFNEVARGIYPTAYGQEGSVPVTVSKDVPMEYEYSLTLPGNVANVDNVSIVVLLLDSTTGEIVNADKMSLGDTPSGIQSITRGNNGTDNWYNLNGQFVDRPTKGLYIHHGKKVLFR